MNKQSILGVFAAFAASLLWAGTVNAMGVSANANANANRHDLSAIIKHELPSVGVNGGSVQDYLSTLSRGHATQGHIPQVHVPQGSFLTGAGLATEVQQNLANEIARNNSRFGGTSVVPIPAAVWLLASGLGFLAFFGRKNATARTL